MAAAFISLVALAAWMIVSQYTQGGFGRDAAALSKVGFEEATGVRLKYIAVTAAGGMIDLRYQVVDPDKALIVHDDEEPPTIINEATGIALSRTQHEHSDGELHTGVTYQHILANSGGVIKRGDAVTLVIGDARLEHITVY